MEREHCPCRTQRRERVTEASDHTHITCRINQEQRLSAPRYRERVTEASDHTHITCRINQEQRLSAPRYREGVTEASL